MCKIEAQIPGTTDCDTCFGTTVIDHAGAEIACPDCQPELITVTTIWVNRRGREFTRTTSHLATTVVDAMDAASAELPDTCCDILDQYIAS